VAEGEVLPENPRFNYPPLTLTEGEQVPPLLQGVIERQEFMFEALFSIVGAFQRGITSREQAERVRASVEALSLQGGTPGGGASQGHKGGPQEVFKEGRPKHKAETLIRLGLAKTQIPKGKIRRPKGSGPKGVQPQGWSSKGVKPKGLPLWREWNSKGPCPKEIRMKGLCPKGEHPRGMSPRKEALQGELSLT
jgi:hypothetical protein